MIYLFDPNTFATLFEYDAVLSENRRTEVEWTQRAVEDGATISDYRKVKPEVYKTAGLVTAWPLTPAPRYDVQRVISADDKLRALAKLGQPVSLVTGWWAADVVIKSVDGGSSKSEGEAMRIALEFQTIERPKVQFTTVPASRLKASVKKRATPRPNGGAATGKNVATGANANNKTGKSWAKSLDKRFLGNSLSTLFR